MKKFLDENFMLNSGTAEKLYHSFADVNKLPIIDYHCHIPVSEIWEDRRFNNITELWLGADHYKWRQMRVNGIDEKFITGDGDDFEKFKAFSSIMPRLLGNPLYHWSHLELKRYFDIDIPLKAETAKEIWDKCNAKIQDASFSARGLVKRSNVELLCTTDDPCDDLETHKKIAEDDSFDTKVLPAFRPDAALNILKNGWKDYIEKLFDIAGVSKKDIDSLVEALKIRVEFFKSRGCLVSDHGIFDAVYHECSKKEADEIFKKGIAGESISEAEADKFTSYMLIELAGIYKENDFVMQLHYGVVRDNNTRAFEGIGVDSGFDAMHNENRIYGLLKLLNEMEKRDALPKIILYSLNPVDNASIDCAIGCFAEKGIRGKVQHGSAWWFNDHYEGMKEQIRSYSALSTLGNHIGMLTDSRSFLSYTRHEYFRRILCDYVGSYVESGMYPDDEEELKRLVQGISYYNAKEYFGF